MPYVTITTTSGLNNVQKKQLIEKSSDAIVQVLGSALPSVRVMLHELPEGHYMDGGQWDAPGILFNVDMIEGRTEEQKAELLAAFGKLANEITGYSQDQIHGILHDILKTNIRVKGGLTAKQAGR
ncbi:MAG TPA: tautomerase [Pusillimonas sp.]|jgi:4-oxalocrotonate tautomerase family enzyme|nr:tautomerase [Pusillimonas sp.]MBC41305.1 tautomerase [Pusillimonas sp.]HBT33341.1 tautomerase [Pusillimonas sp.]HCP78438.1 tautomerase [Pusillimonas sp.]|tara:strand:+ start:183229 stop:183603 length:375 start_codon:yes stop_codon:yes gene_type:complete